MQHCAWNLTCIHESFALNWAPPIMTPANKSKALTQEEVWDDSALIRSWDEALEEYKVMVRFEFETKSELTL